MSEERERGEGRGSYTFKAFAVLIFYILKLNISILRPLQHTGGDSSYEGGGIASIRISRREREGVGVHCGRRGFRAASDRHSPRPTTQI